MVVQGTRRKIVFQERVGESELSAGSADTTE